MKIWEPWLLLENWVVGTSEDIFRNRKWISAVTIIIPDTLHTIYLRMLTHQMDWVTLFRNLHPWRYASLNPQKKQLWNLNNCTDKQIVMRHPLRLCEWQPRRRCFKINSWMWILHINVTTMICLWPKRITSDLWTLHDQISRPFATYPNGVQCQNGSYRINLRGVSRYLWTAQATSIKISIGVVPTMQNRFGKMQLQFLGCEFNATSNQFLLFVALHPQGGECISHQKWYSESLDVDCYGQRLYDDCLKHSSTMEVTVCCGGYWFSYWRASCSCSDWCNKANTSVYWNGGWKWEASTSNAFLHDRCYCITPHFLVRTTYIVRICTIPGAVHLVPVTPQPDSSWRYISHTFTLNAFNGFYMLIIRLDDWSNLGQWYINFSRVFTLGVIVFEMTVMQAGS